MRGWGPNKGGWGTLQVTTLTSPHPILGCFPLPITVLFFLLTSAFFHIALSHFLLFFPYPHPFRALASSTFLSSLSYCTPPSPLTPIPPLHALVKIFPRSRHVFGRRDLTTNLGVFLATEIFISAEITARSRH